MHATLWANNRAVDLGVLPGGEWSKAYAINDRGQIAGASDTNANGTHAALWIDGAVIDLSGPEETGRAYGINGVGQVVGYSAVYRDNRQHTAEHATLWQNGKSIDIDLLAVDRRGSLNASFAYGINGSGEIALFSSSAGDDSRVSSVNRAIVWNGTEAKVFEPLAGHLSFANAINNMGQVAGYSRISPKSFDTHAVLWTNSTALDLGTLGGRNANAIALNDAGQVVGESETVDGKTHATLWSGNVAVDLNSHLDPDRKRTGWVLERANGINDRGWIVGEAINEQLKVTRAFLLVPTTYTECRM
jgi:probable HAF family extracellular repeat protein